MVQGPSGGCATCSAGELVADYLQASACSCGWSNYAGSAAAAYLWWVTAGDCWRVQHAVDTPTAVILVLQYCECGEKVLVGNLKSNNSR